MHIVTFYSYKGGVGRTMALVNVAAVLAQRGRKVLIVDFDLEAPGLSTYGPFACLSESKGIVEYVSEYVETAVAPKAADFIVSSKLGDADVWAMPAGRRNREYSRRLASIDWQALYTLQKGYLFFEDLKQQWKTLNFDYVLIDSRTGHTDVGGICTRQLPDAVALMFFPNDQNLVGLESVVKDIREEPMGLRRDKIALHFCASNVPDLDDEHHILERKLKDARRHLSYKENPVIIHHYNSLTLLEQSLFVLDRPASKLTAEYNSLVNAIVAQNLEDRDGAIAELKRIRDVLRAKAEHDGHDRVISTLDQIRELHPSDGQIAWLMAHIYSATGDLDNEVRSLTNAIDGGTNVLTARRRRAALARIEGRTDDALADLYLILSDRKSDAVEFIAAAELLREFDPTWLSVVAASPTLRSLDSHQLLRLADILMSDPRGPELVIELMEPIIAASKADERASSLARYYLILASISSRKFSRAMEALANNRGEIIKSRALADIFNFAMAEWGHTGVAPQDLMSRVVELAERDGHPPTVNKYECVALAYFVSGDSAAAKAGIKRALSVNAKAHGREFSCWRYLEVSRSEMRRDLHSLEQFVEGNGSGPSVFVSDQNGAKLFRS
jgi:tetratricopeptide (TPR) repeat protein